MVSPPHEPTEGERWPHPDLNGERQTRWGKGKTTENMRKREEIQQVLEDTVNGTPRTQALY